MKHKLEVLLDKRELKKEDMFILCKKFPEAGARALLGLDVVKKDPTDDDIYRVEITLPLSQVQIICFGIDRLDDTIEGIYDNINDLPNWMQERLSVLSMLPPNTSGGNDVEGIGRRITESIYWVYAQK